MVILPRLAQPMQHVLHGQAGTPHRPPSAMTLARASVGGEGGTPRHCAASVAARARARASALEAFDRHFQGMGGRIRLPWKKGRNLRPVNEAKTRLPRKRSPGRTRVKTRSEVVDRLVGRAGEGDTFRARLLTDPKPAIHDGIGVAIRKGAGSRRTRTAPMTAILCRRQRDGSPKSSSAPWRAVVSGGTKRDV